MVIDKNYFLNRLANGEDMDVIGQEIADMMTEALNEHNTNLEAEAKRQAEETKRELMEELVEIVQELAILEGMDPEDLEMTDEDMDQLVAAFTEMFAAMRQLKALSARLNEKKSLNKSDDDILNEFVKIFS